jgi:C4-dicarboxylate transporter DctQ subunit
MNNKFLIRLYQIERVFAGVIVAILTTLVIFDVFSREFFKLGLPWAQKTAVYLMIWAGFIGAILMNHKGEHLRPEMGDKIWKGSMKVVVYRFQQLVVLIYCLASAYFSYLYVVETKEMGDQNVVLEVSMWILQVIMPYAFFSMALRSLYYFIFPVLKETTPEDYK